MATESIIPPGTYTVFTRAFSGGYVQYPNDTSKWVVLAPEATANPSQQVGAEPIPRALLIPPRLYFPSGS